MKFYDILRYLFGISRMLLTGISVRSLPLSIWDNLRYPKDKVLCGQLTHDLDVHFDVHNAVKSHRAYARPHILSFSSQDSKQTGKRELLCVSLHYLTKYDFLLRNNKRSLSLHYFLRLTTANIFLM